MFETIASKLQAVIQRLSRRGYLTEAAVREAMREVRLALLEADVNFRVVRDFTDQVTAQAVGEQVLKSVTPGQQVVKIVYDALVGMMGPADPLVHLSPEPPTVIMLAGLQGSGKTTTAAKLARRLHEGGHHPLLVAADMKRPAAIDQLEILGRQLELPVFSRRDGTAAPRICQQAVAEARKQGLDVVILDTAGRLHIDAEMMAELDEVVRTVKPHQTYLVADAMTGQDAVESASRFHERLPLDGVILTKLDADARGGAALSIRAVTGRPIKFVGVGEKVEALEEFHPERMASRILGMGDVVSLVEKAQATMDVEEARAMEEKLRKATFTLEDFLKQIHQMRRIGPFKELLAMIPGWGPAFEQMPIDDSELTRVEAIIQSMTPGERLKPEIIEAGRRRRIALGSGTAPHEVAGLVKQFRQMRGMMKGLADGSLSRVGIGVQDVPGLMARGPVKVKQRSKRLKGKRKKRR